MEVGTPAPSPSRRADCSSHANPHALSTNAAAPTSRTSSSGHNQDDGLCQPPANIAAPSAASTTLVITRSAITSAPTGPRVASARISPPSRLANTK